ncbi:MAG: sugar phosphate isomerase/epimerase [Rhodopirellula sp.]|nr:sugar phosphate isomerase/epimerase [Rhodopirellula sp.]
MTNENHSHSITRRSFLHRSAIAASAGWLASGVKAAASEKHGIRLGAPVFDAPQDPDELAQAHRKLGYRAAYCPAVARDDSDRIRAIARAFEKHDVVIAEVGRWVNLLDADPVKRAANLQTVTDGLTLAESVGARCCVDIAGSFNEEVWYGPHPKNVTREFFDAAVENARKIIDAVKPRRAKFCYEMMGWALPDGANVYREMIEAVDREAFGVHLDPCNLVNSPRRYFGNTDLLNECFDKLGPWIVSCHAKDLAWEVEMNVHFREVTLGAGSLDYTTYLKRLAALPGDVPLMIEHMKGKAEYDQSREHLFALGNRIGVGFGDKAF